MGTNCFAALIVALVWIESGGDEKAIGDGGRAWGCLQIRAGVIADVNTIYGLSYRREDAFDREKAKEICRKYLLYWGKAGKCRTAKDYARIWNGGPRGCRKPGTLAYWDKMKNYYNTVRPEFN